MKSNKSRTVMPCFKKVIQAVPSIFLISLILWTYYTYLVEFCIQEIKRYPIRQMVYLIIGNILFLMFAWSYLHVMFCKRNYKIPAEFKLSTAEHDRLLRLPAVKQSEVLEQYIQKRNITIWMRNSENFIRYCLKCHQIKPDRAHHCSACERCVLKMDHHCPWTNNCVGFFTQKSFLLMLMYGTLACLFYSIVVLEYYLHTGVIKPNFRTAVICSGFLSSAFLILFMSILYSQHIILIFKNETIIETFQNVIFLNPALTFDLGPTQNYLDMAGESCWKWWIPNCSSYGNGVHFEVRYKSSRGS